MQSYSVLTHTFNLWVGLKGKNNSVCGQVAYQINGKEDKSKNFDLTHTYDLLVRLRSDVDIVQISLFFIELTTIN